MGDDNYDRQNREHFVMKTVKEKLLDAADRQCRKRAKHCKEKNLNMNDRVFIKRIQKKGESKLVPKWQGPYRVICRKSPNVYKLKDLRTNKMTTQHIENISERVILAGENELPLAECPDARRPYPRDPDEVQAKTVTSPEGSPSDYFDCTYWLDTEEEVVAEEPLPIPENENCLAKMPGHEYNLRPRKLRSIWYRSRHSGLRGV